MIHDIIFNIFNRNRDKRDDFIEASDAYLKTTYNEQFTKEELKEKLIANIKRQIKNDIKLNRTYINVTTYSGYREKQVLPEVAEYFKTKKYKVIGIGVDKMVNGTRVKDIPYINSLGRLGYENNINNYLLEENYRVIKKNNSQLEE